MHGEVFLHLAPSNIVFSDYPTHLTLTHFNTLEAMTSAGFVYELGSDTMVLQGFELVRVLLDLLISDSQCHGQKDVFY